MHTHRREVILDVESLADLLRSLPCRTREKNEGSAVREVMKNIWPRLRIHFRAGKKMQVLRHRAVVTRTLDHVRNGEAGKVQQVFYVQVVRGLH